MKHLTHTILRFIPLFSLTFLALLTSPATHAADEQDMGEHFTQVLVPEGLDAENVKDAIHATLVGRQWGVMSKSDTQVVGYLKHRSNEATVTMTYDASKVDIYCVGYSINKKSGVRKKPEQPKGWLKNLQQDLVRNLNRTISQK